MITSGPRNVWFGILKFIEHAFNITFLQIYICCEIVEIIIFYILYLCNFFPCNLFYRCDEGNSYLQLIVCWYYLIERLFIIKYLHFCDV
uniref:Uncharacterized protein n=1 Tax=Anguilla anguilla TaxID=7936 RepID=A0A0E9WRD2_ANGAN